VSQCIYHCTYPKELSMKAVRHWKFQSYKPLCTANLKFHSFRETDTHHNPILWITSFLKNVSILWRFLNTNNIFPRTPWLKQLVAGLSPQRPKFYPNAGYVWVVVDKLALAQAFFAGILVYSCWYHFTNAPYTFNHHWCYTILETDSVIK
jgi:hypothetical protein